MAKYIAATSRHPYHLRRLNYIQPYNGILRHTILRYVNDVEVEFDFGLMVQCSI